MENQGRWLTAPGNEGKPPLNMLGGFFKDEAGSNVLEYAFLLTLIAVVIISAISALSGTISTMFTGIATTVSATMGS